MNPKLKGYNRSAEHTALVNALMLVLGRRDDLIVIKRDAGAARALHNHKVVFEYGRVGEGDLMVLLAPRGRVLWLEAKTGKAKQSEEQKFFHEYVHKVGGQYFVFHSVEEALAIIESAER